MIKHIKLDGFCDQFQWDFDLEAPVTIMIGINGSGKTTLLNLVKAALSPESPHYARLEESLPPFKGMEVTTDSGKIEFEKDMVTMGASFQRKQLHKKGIEIPVRMISPEDGMANKFHYVTHVGEDPQTITLMEPVLDLINESVSKELRISFKNGRIQFPYAVNVLSAGAMQMLSCMAFAATAEEGTVCLYDLPETHMHIVWQEEFVKLLQQCCVARNTQAIIATHAPAILTEYNRICKAPLAEAVHIV